MKSPIRPALTKTPVLRKMVIALTLALVVVVSALHGQDRESQSNATQEQLRYQLVAAPITVTGKGGSSQWDEHRLFLVDSSSG
jgi:hypothetical protein